MASVRPKTTPMMMAASAAGEKLLLLDPLEEVEDRLVGGEVEPAMVVESSVVVMGNVLVAFQPPPVQLGQHPT
jgi:hypothetical protein